MTDTTNDINALLEYLDAPWRQANHKIALALVAERDALRMRVAELTGELNVLNVLVAARSVSRERIETAKQRVAELESQPTAERDLRERLVCALIVPAFELYSASRNVNPATYAVTVADAVLAAMRKGDTDGK
jgi:hypothetical protein